MIKKLLDSIYFNPSAIQALFNLLKTYTEKIANTDTE